MEERFKDIKGFEGIYKIGDKGTLLSFTSGKWIARSNVNKNGWYFTVILRKDGQNYTFRIHRLVYEHFVGEIPKGHKWHIHHKDHNKQNNCVENLELVSAEEHYKKDIDSRDVKGMNHYNKYVKPQKIIQKDLQGNFIAIYENAAEASRATGVCARNIKQVAGKEEFCPGHIRKQAGGFIWEQVSR